MDRRNRDGRVLREVCRPNCAGCGGATSPYFDHAGRVQLLRSAVEVAASCDHRALARLRNVVETRDGPVLVYDRAPGELIATPRDQRNDPASPYRRFASLPAERHVPIIRELFDAHVALAAAGWIACDLYDGGLIVDFSSDRLTLIDLDTYIRGPFLNTMVACSVPTVTWRPRSM
jgi:serine/threonine-protein kinase